MMIRFGIEPVMIKPAISTIIACLDPQPGRDVGQPVRRSMAVGVGVGWLGPAEPAGAPLTRHGQQIAGRASENESASGIERNIIDHRDRFPHSDQKSLPGLRKARVDCSICMQAHSGKVIPRRDVPETKPCEHDLAVVLQR